MLQLGAHNHELVGVERRAEIDIEVGGHADVGGEVEQGLGVSVILWWGREEGRFGCCEGGSRGGVSLRRQRERACNLHVGRDGAYWRSCAGC